MSWSNSISLVSVLLEFRVECWVSVNIQIKQLGHGPTVKIGQVCKQTELMIVVKKQDPNGPQQHLAQLLEGTELNVMTLAGNGIQRTG